MVWTFVLQNQIGPPPAPEVAAPAERLSFAKLAADEEIVVMISAHRREPVELRFRHDGIQPKLILSSIAWSQVDRAWKMVRVLEVRPLAAREAAGLDAVVAHLRASGPPITSHLATYEIDYRRAEMSIGREKLFERLLVIRRNEFHRSPPESADGGSEIEREVAHAGIAPEEFQKWVTFEMLLPRDDAPN